MGIARELARLPRELELVREDLARVSGEARTLDAERDEMRHQVRQVEESMAREREEFTQKEREITDQIRRRTGERKKSDGGVDHLDREKRKPYRAIGACLADNGIAPLNQPEVLQKVFQLRTAQSEAGEEMARLREETAGLKRMGWFYAVTVGLVVAVIALSIWFGGR